MKALLPICAVITALPPVEIVVAKTTRLQTVNLNDRQMSTEGGEARLYWVIDPKRTFCRIEAIHYGETGKAIYVFDFESKLIAATSSEYDCDLPIYMTSNVKQSLKERTTLASREGRKALTKDFDEYKSFFDAAQLAKCSGK